MMHSFVNFEMIIKVLLDSNGKMSDSNTKVSVGIADSLEDVNSEVHCEPFCLHWSTQTDKLWGGVEQHFFVLSTNCS